MKKVIVVCIDNGIRLNTIKDINLTIGKAYTQISYLPFSILIENDTGEEVWLDYSRFIPLREYNLEKLEA